MSIPRQTQKRPKKPPACDSCKASALALLDDSANCPSLTPEFVAHCFHCLEFLPQIGHPLIGRTRIKDSIHAANFEPHLLPPQSRVVALCIISVTSLASFHESILRPGPRPKSFTDHEFFTSSADLRGCGVRRTSAHRALRVKAIRSACEIGVMLEPTEENALLCCLLDLLDQSDSCGSSRPWAGAYIFHIRVLGAHAGEEENIPRLKKHGGWDPCTLQNQLLLSGSAPSSLDSFLESLETWKKPGLQVLYPSMKPYFFLVVCLARQLFVEINGDYPRLNPLSEAAVIKFLSALNLLHSIASLLLARVDAAIEPSAHDCAPFRYEGNNDTTATAHAVCGCGIIVGFVGLVLLFYCELQLRGDEGEPSAQCERMQLVRTQAREIAILGAHELARALRYLPPLRYTPLNWRIVYPWAEFCVENVPENLEDLETITNELKMIV
ncbi:hypothetical protein K438DRAFT_1983927 [Mycena galopus ATCC 62051]|nr:hypothetical protein K438DRAFT_1983927 [Mycena galopus ATCC 62051]